MDNKIQELAEKIYKDGVEKAENEATAIIQKAEADCDAMLLKAKEEAERIIQVAKKTAEETTMSANKEIEISLSNAQSTLQNAITNLLSSMVVKESVENIYSDPNKLHELVLTISKEIIKGGDSSVSIATANKSDLECFFLSKANDILGKELTLKEIEGKPYKFEIHSNEGGYKIEISQESLAEYFKDYLRPKLRNYLFGESK